MELTAEYLLCTCKHCYSIFKVDATNNDTWFIDITYTLEIYK